MNIGMYSKALATMVVVTLTAYISALADGVVTPVEWTVILAAAVGATAIVWAIPQVPEVLRTYGKSVAAGLTAGLASLGVGFSDGVLTQPEILTAIVAFITGAGLVGAVPNAAFSDSTLTDSNMGWGEPDDQVRDPVPDEVDAPEGAAGVVDLNGQEGYPPDKV